MDHSINSLFDLTGKVALVTGGTGHLGSVFVETLAAAGASMVVASRDARRAEAVVAQLPTPQKQNHSAIALDHELSEGLVEAFQQAAAGAGGIDILVNNANSAIALDLTTIDAGSFNRQLQDSTAYFLLARAMRDHCVSRNTAGSIVMLGSMYGLVGSYPDAYSGVCPASSVAYHALKGGVVQMTRHLAVYWAKDNVRVNCLSPGPFPAATAPGELKERLIKKSPMGRLGDPSELRGAMLLLASDAGSYITGQNLVVDGGWTAW